MEDLRILSGGAANGLVSALTGRFKDETGLGISGDFGAVGGMRDRVLAGEAVELVILTKAILDELAESGHVVAETVTDLGRVVTGIAVRDGMPRPDVSTGDGLREALRAADGIYFPNPAQATAGIHFAGVMRALGIFGEVAHILHSYPNGQTAMAALAASDDLSPLGCTQITEILNTPGVVYAGDLPVGYGLETTYTAGITTWASRPDAARALIRVLTAPDAAEVRSRVGFSQ